MAELTIHTGPQRDTTVIHVEWFDENNVQRRTEVKVKVADQDKPRTLQVIVNGVVVASQSSRDF